MHDSFTNKFTFVHNDCKTILAPLTSRKVSQYQFKMRKKRKEERREKKKMEKEGEKEKEIKKSNL